jgi:hypothetical protein
MDMEETAIPISGRMTETLCESETLVMPTPYFRFIPDQWAVNVSYIFKQVILPGMIAASLLVTLHGVVMPITQTNKLAVEVLLQRDENNERINKTLQAIAHAQLALGDKIDRINRK